MKPIEVIAHNCWQKLIRMNWANVSGHIEDAINESTAALQHEIQQREREVSKLNSEIVGLLHELADVRKLLKETAHRAQFILPMDPDSIQHFEDGTDHQKSGDFIPRLYHELGVSGECDKCNTPLSAGLFCPNCE